MRNQNAVRCGSGSGSGSGPSGMVQLTPHLASLDGTGEFPQPKEEVGAHGQGVGQLVEMENPATPVTKTRPIPSNFVWRLDGGRRHSPGEPPIDIDEGAMAVDVPAFRDSFDPWGQHHEHQEDDGRCKGCSKIAKARAAAAAAVAAAEATTAAAASHHATPSQSSGT